MKQFALISILAVFLLSGCGTIGVQIGLTPANPTPPVAPAAATATPAQSPSAVDPAVTGTDTPPAVDPPATLMVKMVLIAVDDQGKSGDPVGCGDSAVAAQVEIPYTQGVLKAAIQRLLALKDQFYGESGLYNALYQSDLRLDSVTIKDSAATVNLSGSLKLGGECDNPRVEAQLTKTALQFSTVSRVSIFINGKPLKDALSLK